MFEQTDRDTFTGSFGKDTSMFPQIAVRLDLAEFAFTKMQEKYMEIDLQQDNDYELTYEEQK